MTIKRLCEWPKFCEFAVPHSFAISIAELSYDGLKVEQKSVISLSLVEYRDLVEY